LSRAVGDYATAEEAAAAAIGLIAFILNFPGALERFFGFERREYRQANQNCSCHRSPRQ